MTYGMEAGGIEPPSRDSFKGASTCIVGRLFSPPRAPTDRLSRPPARLFSHRDTVRRRFAASPLAAPRGIVGVSRETGYQFLGSHGIVVAI